MESPTPEYGHTVDYHDLPGLSNSRLKLLRKSPKLFQRAIEHGWKDEQKNHHIEGDMIDKMLLDYTKFQRDYIMQTWDIPASAQQQQFAKMVAEGESPDIAYDQVYKATLKPATLAKKSSALESELYDYIQHLKTGDLRTPYNPAAEQMLMGIQNSAMKHPIASKLLNHRNKENHKIIQVELFEEDFKIEVDLYIQIGSKEKVTVLNIDVKSTQESLSSFPFVYRRFGYHYQQALYRMTIRKWLEDQGYKNITIKTLCVAAEKAEPYSVLVYDVSDDLLKEGEEWIRETVELYKFHKTHGFDYPKSTYEKGVETIDVYEK